MMTDTLSQLRPRLGPDEQCPFAVRTDDGEQLPLIAQCTIPGCKHPVAEWGDVCSNCIADFGPMLRPGPVPLTKYEIEERDRQVANAYAMQRTNR